MRISFVDDEPEIFPMQYGGKARTILTLARSAVELEGIEDVRVLSRSIDDPRDSFDVDGIGFERLDGYNMVGQIAKEVDEADIVSVHTCSFTLPRFPKRRAALIYNLHDVMLTTADKGSHLDKALAGDWDAIVSPSEFATQVLHNFSAVTSSESTIRTIPRGVDLEVFHAIPRHQAIAKLREWGVDISDETKPVVFVPSRFNAGKGEDYLNTICRSLSARYSNFTVLTTSEAEDKQNIHPNIQCVGWLETEKLQYFYSASDVTLSLSKLPESFSQICIESVACDTAVLSFRFGNLAKLVDTMPAIKGCDPNIESILLQLDKVLENRTAISADITKSREIVEANFSSNVVASQYLSLYAALVKRRREKLHVPRHNVYFVSPFVSIHGSRAYVCNDASSHIEEYLISEDEAAVLADCTNATTREQLVLTTGLRSETITTIISKLVMNRLIIGGKYG